MQVALPHVGLQVNIVGPINLSSTCSPLPYTGHLLNTFVDDFSILENHNER